MNLGAVDAVVDNKAGNLHLFAINGEYRGVRVLFRGAHFRLVRADDHFAFAKIYNENRGRLGFAGH